MTDIPGRHSETYSSWVRATALNAAARIVAGQVDEKTHPAAVITRLEPLITWAEAYLKTGRIPPSDR